MTSCSVVSRMQHFSPYAMVSLCSLHTHGVSLGTDTPKQTITQQFFLSPQALENLASPPR